MCGCAEWQGPPYLPIVPQSSYSIHHLLLTIRRLDPNANHRTKVKKLLVPYFCRIISQISYHVEALAQSSCKKNTSCHEELSTKGHMN